MRSTAPRKDSLDTNSQLVTFDSEDEEDMSPDIKKMVQVEDIIIGVTILVENLKKQNMENFHM